MTIVISSANRGGGGSTWDPSVLGSALKLWYRSFTTGTTNTSAFTDSGGTTLATNGQEIHNWGDVSGNGVSNAAFIQNGSTSGPTWVTSGINSKPALHFSSPVGLMNGDLGSLLSTNCSFFAVAQMTSSTSAYGRMLSMVGSATIDATNDTFIPFIRQNSTSNMESFTGTGGTGDLAAVAMGTSAPQRIGVIKTGSSFEMYLNGTASGSPVSQAITMGVHQAMGLGFGINAGYVPNLTAAFDGYVGEVVITNTALSSPDIASLDTYLQTKYGL